MMMSRRSLRNSAVVASPGQNEARVGSGLRLLAKRLRIGLAKQRLRRLRPAAAGPCAGAPEEQPQGGETEREERAASAEP